LDALLIGVYFDVATLAITSSAVMETFCTLIVGGGCFYPKIYSFAPIELSGVLMRGLTDEVVLVIVSVEMFVSPPCSPGVDWKVSWLTGVVNSQSECLVSPVSHPSHPRPGSIVPVEFLHDFLSPLSSHGG